MGYQDQRVILELVKSLREHNSWAGRTHVQKAAYLVSVLRHELPFEFILYKHGPYSFQLDAELNAMLSYGALGEVYSDPKYGAKLTDKAHNSGWLKNQADLPEGLFTDAIDSVVQLIADKNTRDLEKLATAAWIETQEHTTDVDQIASRLHELKPHIALPDAQAAVNEFNQMKASITV